MALKTIEAVVRITDGGHLIAPGATAEVPAGYAAEWIARGWAKPAIVPAKPKK